MELEIFCDASIKTYPNGRMFGCAGAIAPQFNMKKFEVLPDVTNNRSEIEAIYLAVQMAKEIITYNKIDSITIYSDSKLSIYGLREWMGSWMRLMVKGVIYTNTGTRVKNQEVFLRVLDFLVKNNMKVNLRHQKGHVKILNQKSFSNAREVFYNSNGYYLQDEVLSRICIFNNKIDSETRELLQIVNPNDYDVAKSDEERGLTSMCYCIPPKDYYKYIS